MSWILNCIFCVVVIGVVWRVWVILEFVDIFDVFMIVGGVVFYGFIEIGVVWLVVCVCWFIMDCFCWVIWCFCVVFVVMVGVCFIEDMVMCVVVMDGIFGIGCCIFCYGVIILGFVILVLCNEYFFRLIFIFMKLFG